ncbi:hypothetical protein [Natronorarus salvus]|uniref:hypothetical protein n=1 Tax=Natronorarus salvus TaxID=3117733 RepID=UPI002F26AE69
MNQALVEFTLQTKGSYTFWELPRIHLSEQRRFLEGLVQHNRIQEENMERQHYERDGASPAVAEKKRRMKAGQNAGRQSMFDEINQEAAA